VRFVREVAILASEHAEVGCMVPKKPDDKKLNMNEIVTQEEAEEAENNSKKKKHT